LSRDEDSGEVLASKLLMDIKALTILYPSDVALKGILAKSFVDDSDDDVRRLTRVIVPERREDTRGSALIAASEILLASFLAILGIGSLIPSMIGLGSPRQLVDYFAGQLAPSFGTGPLAVAAPIVDLAFSFLLVVGALLLLRRAALELKEAGLVVETSGS